MRSKWTKIQFVIFHPRMSLNVRVRKSDVTTVRKEMREAEERKLINWFTHDDDDEDGKHSAIHQNPIHLAHTFGYVSELECDRVKELLASSCDTSV